MNLSLLNSHNKSRYVEFLFSFLQMGKLRPKEVKKLAEGHKASRWQSWSLTLGPCDSKGLWLLAKC